MDTFLNLVLKDVPHAAVIKPVITPLFSGINVAQINLKDPAIEAFINSLRTIVFDSLKDMAKAQKVDVKTLTPDAVVATVETVIDDIKDTVQSLQGPPATKTVATPVIVVPAVPATNGVRKVNLALKSVMDAIKPGQWSPEEDEDLNGNSFIGSQEGEVLVQTVRNTILVQPWLAVPVNALEVVKIQKDDFMFFMALNIIAVRGADNTINEREAVAIALHRYYALRDGLVSPLFEPNTYFVKYTECVWASDVEVNAASAFLSNPVSQNFMTLMTDDLRKKIRETFTDRICLLAFVFRVRGHHYMNSFEELYVRVWGKCRYDMSTLGLTFQQMMTASFHAIFPVILDNFWNAAVTDGRCNGALVKRFNSACAGAAGPYVVQQGIQDIEQIAPGVRKHLNVAISYLEALMPRLDQHRFAGSVNHRYYGVQRVMIDERKLGAAAAVVKAAIDGLASGAPLGQSAALTRIARYAPVTGSVLARAIGNLSNRAEVVNPLLEAE